MRCPLPFLSGKRGHDRLRIMSTSSKDQRFISGLLLVCSVASLLLFLSYAPKRPGIDGETLAAAFNTHSVIHMYELFAAGALERGHHFSLFNQTSVSAILILTAALALWNFALSRKEVKVRAGVNERHIT